MSKTMSEAIAQTLRSDNRPSSFVNFGSLDAKSDRSVRGSLSSLDKVPDVSIEKGLTEKGWSESVNQRISWRGGVKVMRTGASVGSSSLEGRTSKRSQAIGQSACWRRVELARVRLTLVMSAT
jgi:hypothetical protein